MTLDLTPKPKTPFRAEEMQSKFERRMKLCANESCLKSGTWFVDGVILCKTHAGRAALEVLSKEER